MTRDRRQPVVVAVVAAIIVLGLSPAAGTPSRAGQDPAEPSFRGWQASPARSAPAGQASAAPAPRVASQAPGAAPTGAPIRLAVALHVHSRVSPGGSLTPLEIARLARQEGVDVVVLTDTLVREFRYGPPLLRWMLEVRRTEPALLDHGVERWLDEVRAADAEVPEVVLIPGVEVTPYYRWSGSLARRRLTLHDFQRDLAVIPPPGDDAAAARFVRELPVIGNPGAGRLGPASLLEVIPGLALLLLGFLLARWRREAATRDHRPPPPRQARGGARASSPGHRRGASRRWRRAAGLLVAVAGGALLVHHFPYRAPVARPYDGGGFAAEQRLIDFVAARGGLTLWSTPEVAHHAETTVGPVTVILDSPAYLEGVVATRGHDGFGGLYADTVRAIEPGGWWDELLLDHAAGRRDDPVFTVGEADFRATGQAGKFLSEVLSIVEVDEPTAAAVLRSLAAGRSHAVRQGIDDGLRLEELTVRSGAGSAGPGERLAATTRDVTVVAAVASRTGAGLPCRVRLIRQGEVVAEWEGVTPLRVEHPDSLPPGARTVAYRLDVAGLRPHRLVTNPVHVDLPPGGAS